MTMICTYCKKEFERAYRVNARRKSQPRQFCSKACDGRSRSEKSWANYGETFWSRLKPPNGSGCREWAGNRTLRRYGLVDLGGRPQMTHRVAYRLATGKDPGDLSVCHTCDNPPCCEPSHLWLGTHKQNMLDMAAKGRTNAPTFMGEKHPSAKLRAADILAIRASSDRASALAVKYGVTAENITRIRSRQTWKHI